MVGVSDAIAIQYAVTGRSNTLWCPRLEISIRRLHGLLVPPSFDWLTLAEGPRQYHLLRAICCESLSTCA